MRKASQAQRAAKTLLNGSRSGAGKQKLVAMDADLFGGTLEPLMPFVGALDKMFSSFFGRKDKPSERFKQARELSESSDFFGSVIYLKNLFFNDGFNFGERQNKPLLKWLRGKNYDFARVADDVWQEWLICDNVVAFWIATKDEKLPIVTVLDCEMCEYRNAFGIETLSVQLPKLGLTDADYKRLKDKGLDERYIDALRTGKKLVLDESKGEFFKVLTRAKLGRGLGPPRVDSVLQQLSIMEVLGIGDWAWARQMSRAMRQFQKGHEIKQGPWSGQSMHFLKAAEASQIKKANAKKEGAYDSATNFDLNVKFPFPDPRVFDQKKYDGTLARLEFWAGPIGKLLLAISEQSPYAMDMFQAEGFAHRQKVGEFLRSIFMHESFIGTDRPSADLVPRWNPRSFTSIKNLTELARFGYTDGIVSPQTVREWLGVSDEEEGDRQEAASKKPKRYTPPFEAKQGMVAGGNRGGRPVETPSGAPAPA